MEVQRDEVGGEVDDGLASLDCYLHRIVCTVLRTCGPRNIFLWLSFVRFGSKHPCWAVTYFPCLPSMDDLSQVPDFLIWHGCGHPSCEVHVLLVRLLLVLTGCVSPCTNGGVQNRIAMVKYALLLPFSASYMHIVSVLVSRWVFGLSPELGFCGVAALSCFVSCVCSRRETVNM